MSWDGYLKDKLQKYPYKNEAREDSLHALREFTNLRPEHDTFVHPDGRRSPLVCLKGTIPVRFQGSVYNIPVKIWLLETYPHTPPMAYVEPTSTMVIKPGKHVDQSGKIYLPYLSDWRYRESDLHSLLQILCSIFGEEPPVFSRPQQQRPGPAQQAQRPPYPYGGFQAGTAVNSPYPAQPSGMPQPQMRMPQTIGYGQNNTPYPVSSAGVSSRSAAPYPTGSSSSMPGYTASRMPYQSTPGYPTATAGYRPPATTTPYNTYQSQPQQSNHLQRQDTLPDDAMKASILSAVEEKMKRRVKQTYAQAKYEMESIDSTSRQLNEGKQKLDGMMDKLSHEKETVIQNTQIIEQKTTELNQVIEKLKANSDDMNIDEAVVTTAPLYSQILNLFAEENAVEDAIYYLGEALRKEAIDMESFLKHVRSLSRQQFYLRALLEKARQTAGLGALAR